MKLLERSPARLTKHDERLVNGLQVLSDKSRFRIFKLLLNKHRELCVSEIAHELGISTSAVSQHFRIFELMSMVSKRRYGQKICYGLKQGDALVDILSVIVKPKK